MKQQEKPSSQPVKSEQSTSQTQGQQQPVQNIICENADIQGNVKFGTGNIVNPGCQIIADKECEIIFGDFNIIDERCYIHMKAQKDKLKNLMVIGSYNIFEVGSKIDSSNIGDNNTFEVRSCLEANCELKNNCTIGSTAKLPPKQKLDNNMKIYYPDKLVKDQQFDEEQHRKNVMSLYEILAQLIPKGNPIKKK